MPDSLEPIIVQEKDSGLAISDVDTDVLFDEERNPLNEFLVQHLKCMSIQNMSMIITLAKSEF